MQKLKLSMKEQRKKEGLTYKEARKVFRTASRLKRSRLDFNSWFDMWHTHNDWEGQANSSTTIRRLQLRQLLNLQNVLIGKLRHRGHEAQVFVWVSELSSGDDAVYVHTANPNGTPYPYVPGVEKWLDCVPRMLQGVVSLQQYKIGSSSFGQEGRSFYLERRL